MRRLARFIIVGLCFMPAALRAQCNSSAPVVARPIGQGTSQFTFQVPIGPPNMIASTHWMLVDDFVDCFTGTTLQSGFYSMPPLTTAKTESFIVKNPGQDGAGLTFASCTIRAQIMTNGPGNSTIHLIVKQGATQVDGPPRVVTQPVLQEFDSPMATNPITGLAWTSDDLSTGNTVVGVKNDANPNTGVGLESIVLQCE